MPAATATARSRRPSPGRRATRPRAASRWEGLDIARGTLVIIATVLGVAAPLAAEIDVPTAWLGLHLGDLVPGAFLVVVGAGMGWRHDTGRTWTTGRRTGRAVVLTTAALAVIAARAGGEFALFGADELLRLGAATALAALLVRLPRPAVVASVPLLLLAPAALVAGDPLGRGLGGADPGAVWMVEDALGLPTTGVPATSLPAAVGLVLIGYGLGMWVHRRPVGPATAAALLTVALWTGVGTLVVGQIVAPAPVLLDLPVALGATAAAAATAGVGHLLALRGAAAGLAAVGRVAIVPVTLGAVLLGLAGRVDLTQLPPLAAVTAGVVAAAGVIAGARRLDATGHHLRA